MRRLCSRLGLVIAGLIGIFGAPLALVIAATVIRGGFAQDIPPYFWMEDGEAHGIEVEIMRAALEPLGYKIEAKSLPIKRMAGTFIGGDLDFAAGLQPGEVTGAVYSDQFLEYADYAVTKTGRGLVLSSLDDLFKYRVVSWQSAFTALGLDRRHLAAAPAQPNGGFLEAPDSESQIRFFWADRADVIIIDKFIYLWYARQLNSAADPAPEVTFHDLFAPQIRVRIGFKNLQLRDDFNKGLNQIKASGDYQRILANYLRPVVGASNGDRSARH